MENGEPARPISNRVLQRRYGKVQPILAIVHFGGRILLPECVVHQWPRRRDRAIGTDGTGESVPYRLRERVPTGSNQHSILCTISFSAVRTKTSDAIRTLPVPQSLTMVFPKSRPERPIVTLQYSKRKSSGRIIDSAASGSCG